MKKFIIVCVSFVSLIIVSLFFVQNNKSKDNSYLRVHIRANSNLECDQKVKYVVKSAVVDYLTPLIAEGSSFEDVYNILKSNLDNIEKVADKVLDNNGYNYTASAKLRDEYFPTRSYDGYTLENGYYDALIINLGLGEGDNWWCVVYPPLCFIGSEGNLTTNIKYKSKLMEIIKNFFN